MGDRVPPPIQERLGRLRWPVQGRLGRHTSGDERSRHLGPGLEYAGTREYVAGDDPRLIDWNLTARSAQAYVRQAHPDRGLDAWILLDRSRSLDWGTALQLKRDTAAELVAATATLLARHGNRVGVILFDRTVQRVIRPQSGRRARAALLAELKTPSLQETDGGTDLGGALALATRLIRHPSLLVVVSDFMAADGWQAPLRVLGLRHELVAAVVSDPRESDLPDVGLVTFEDPETGVQMDFDTGSASLRRRFREAALARDGALRAELRSARAALVEMSTDEEVLPQLLRFFRQSAALARRRPVAVRTA